MSQVAKIIWNTVGVLIGLGLMIAAIVWGFRSTPTQEPCAALHYNIYGQSDTAYITTGELNKMLTDEDIYPVGRAVNRVSLHRIEQCIGHHPMVRNAECYLTYENEVEVNIDQRIPIVSVWSKEGAYLIDTERRMVPNRYRIKEWTLQVRSHAGLHATADRLADFAEWVMEHPYWQQRIKYVEVKSPTNIRLHLTNTPSVIVLGALRDYDRKLAKLRTFFEQGKEELGDKQYEELDIRFRGQVVGRGLKNQ